MSASATGTARSATGCCGRCWPRPGCGSARRSALKHRDWHTGLGDTPFVEVVPREDHPHGLRVKNGGYRKIFVSDELDRLYGEYLWQLCDAGADVAVGDLDSWWVFVNLAREPRFAADAG